MNKVVLIGRLTKDPELRYTQNGKAYCNFTIAVDRRFSKEKEADFINCVAWEKTAEFVSNYFAKGKQIALEGSIQTRSWKADNGENRYATEVRVDTVEFVGGKNESDPKKNSAESLGEEIQFDDNDLPF